MIGNTAWQVNRQRLLSNNPNQAATDSFWPTQTQRQYVQANALK